MKFRRNKGSRWIQDPEIGGGRVIGEVCHFVDFLTFLCGALPVSVHASAMDDDSGLNDVVAVTLKFSNGSVGTICYFSNGDKSLPKERIEVFSSGVSLVLDDFKSLSVYANGKKKEKKLLSQDKGQKQEVKQFISCIRKGKPAPISWPEIYSSSLATFKILESIRSSSVIPIEMF